MLKYIISIITTTFSIYQKVIVPICTIFGLWDNFSHIQILWSQTILSRKKLYRTTVMLRQMEAKPAYQMFSILASDELNIQEPSFLNWGYRFGSVHCLQKQSSSLWDLKWNASTEIIEWLNFFFYSGHWICAAGVYKHWHKKWLEAYCLERCPEGKAVLLEINQNSRVRILDLK